MNKHTQIIMIVMFVIIAVLVTVLVINKDKIFSNNKDSINIYEEYNGVDKNNVFTYIDVQDAIKLLKSGTGIICFGFPECPWCQAYFPILNEVAKENNVDTIYYYDIKEIRKENTAEYTQIVSLVKDYLYDDENGNKRVYVPDVYFVKDGKILGHNNDTCTISGGSPKEYYTKEVRNKLKKDLKQLILKLDEKCSDNTKGGC